ncbi:MAG: DMT family transporter, partial [Xanthobacteraceae bacterium]
MRRDLGGATDWEAGGGQSREVGTVAQRAAGEFTCLTAGGIRMSGARAQRPVPNSVAKSRGVRGWLFDQPYLLLSLTSLFWAGNTVLGRFVAGHVPPITLAFIRWSGATLILLPFATRHVLRDWPVIRKNAGVLILIAFVGFSVYNTMAYYGLQY